MEQESKSFESSLQRLEEIVKRMEQGNVPLAESLQLFEEGTGLVSQCSALLDEAELKVVRLMKGPDGKPVEMEFEDGEPF
ncbi:MAG: exodeoxyribonuclease VII small subunit [Candidatus Avoscillospira sp.]